MLLVRRRGFRGSGTPPPKGQGRARDGKQSWDLGETKSAPPLRRTALLRPLVSSSHSIKREVKAAVPPRVVWGSSQRCTKSESIL